MMRDTALYAIRSLKFSGLLLLSLATLFSCQMEREGAGSLPPIEDKPYELIASGESDPVADARAVRGGTYTIWASSWPKSLNRWLDNNSLSSMISGLMFESLVTLHSTENQPVGQLAESWQISPDGRTYTFQIRPEAIWSDGEPITARDIQFYYDVIMDPTNMTSLFRVGLGRFDRPEIIDDKTVRITANENHWQNFWEAASLSAFPSHVWDREGEEFDFNRVNFEFPVVSGPYEIHAVRQNRSLVLSRRADWWGRALPYNQNKYNFDYLRYRFMEEQNKALEAFRKGDFDAFPFYTASLWANGTDFDDVRNGLVVRRSFVNLRPRGFQGFAINLRRERFQDPLVRRALTHLINREMMNEKLMFDTYFLLNSYYPDLYSNHQNPDVELRRYDPERARALLTEAGWTPGSDGILRNTAGERFTLQFLTAASEQRHLNVYREDLRGVGIEATIEQLNQSSVRRRIDNHEFDLYWVNWGAGRLKDPEAMWHSRTADEAASVNLPGVRDELIDRLIEEQKSIQSIDRRNQILRRIDKRLDEITPYVLLWQSDRTRLLYWNRFGMPEEQPLGRYFDEDAIIVYWWFDPERAAELERIRAEGGSMEAERGEEHRIEM